MLDCGRVTPHIGGGEWCGIFKCMGPSIISLSKTFQTCGTICYFIIQNLISGITT